jgi:uncharacterized membrane protein YphA (DoxX/SURF4 family)
MKKLILTLTLLLAFSLSFATNSVNKITFDEEKSVELVKSMDMDAADYSVDVADLSEDFGTCVVTIGLFGEDGESLGTFTVIITNVDSAAECDALGDAIVDELNNML